MQLTSNRVFSGLTVEFVRDEGDFVRFRYQRGYDAPNTHLMKKPAWQALPAAISARP